MIDYVKIQFLSIDIDRLKKLEILDFIIEVSEKTGLLSDKMVANYGFCKIIVYENGVVIFSGSIHKLFNKLNGVKAPNYKDVPVYKGFNGNKLTLDDILMIRNHLEWLFDCDSSQMIFQNIEFGVNTTPAFDPTKYLKGLLFHKNKLFEYKFNSNFAQAIHQRFIFKIYNKSGQYKMKYSVLRVELKIIKSIELKKIGVVTFADINRRTLDKAKELLLKRFNEVMHYDHTIQRIRLNTKTNQLLNSYSNPRYWINELKPNHRDRHKKRLREITLKFSDNLHLHLRNDIIQKCVSINRTIETENV